LGPSAVDTFSKKIIFLRFQLLRLDFWTRREQRQVISKSTEAGGNAGLLLSCPPAGGTLPRVRAHAYGERCWVGIPFPWLSGRHMADRKRALELGIPALREGALFRHTGAPFGI